MGSIEFLFAYCVSTVGCAVSEKKDNEKAFTLGVGERSARSFDISNGSGTKRHRQPTSETGSGLPRSSEELSNERSSSSAAAASVIRCPNSNEIFLYP
ncbi:unnamed protein product [Dibothriocephalus latus]|uniref:Uncharacterized protein n=1 Tax=Dibothriocephalus latus TaxID=60516 RepID=A0A3P7NJJ7_DIBLA|nr:unnamed protein product [Dibothriocephalus latus]